MQTKGGEFPFEETQRKVKEIGKMYDDTPRKIEAQLAYLSKKYPNLAKNPIETTDLLTATVINKENMQADRSVVKNVYDKADESKEPVLFIYTSSEKFYYANKEKAEFTKLPKEEFVNKFECYQMDIDKNNRT